MEILKRKSIFRLIYLLLITITTDVHAFVSYVLDCFLIYILSIMFHIYIYIYESVDKNLCKTSQNLCPN